MQSLTWTDSELSAMHRGEARMGQYKESMNAADGGLRQALGLDQAHSTARPTIDGTS
ncbi:hypothetical protein [Actinomadura harenae]|uniref:hypothetical protein n=1 Tax=Actinomadura harenae TaxID=2483351 RepID=UPI0013152D64|nr:hypothetical protein [Actinomadura harenae]